MAGTTQGQGVDLSVRGFQGSMTSHCEVRFYSLQRDHRRLLSTDIKQRQELVCDGADEYAPRPAVVSATTSNSFGTAGGTWEVVLKPARFAPRDLREAIVEDDWVDIVFFRHGVPYHAYSGIVDTVSRVRRVVSGATDINFIVSGVGFGKPFEMTPLWFDRYSDGDYIGFAASRVWNQLEDFFDGPPNETVKSILYGFLREVRGQGRGTLPTPQLPGEPSRRFGDIRAGSGALVAGQFVDSAFSGFPARRSAIAPDKFDPESGFLWPLASAWADPAMCELYCELGPQTQQQTRNTATGQPDRLETETSRNDTNIYFEPAQAVPLGAARRYVYFRDRPFPTLNRRDAQGVLVPNLNGIESPYFRSIPRYDIPPEAVFDERTVRSGKERKNAFFMTPRLTTEMLTNSAPDLGRPLIDVEDIEVHGLRRLDIASRYVTVSTANALSLVTDYRAILRDFHALNDLYYSGTVVIRPGRPDIRLGGRLRVFEAIETPDQTSSHRDPAGSAATTYYIEGVSHQWSRPQGLVTTCSVTRGWRGSDQSLVDALSQLNDRYVVPPPFEPNIPAGSPSTEPAQVSTPSVVHLEPITNTSGFAGQEGGFVEPGSDVFVGLFTEAALLAGVPTEWAQFRTLAKLIENESGGYVGRPNFTYGERATQRHRWPEVWAELRSGQITSNAVVRGGTRFERSSATGLGQLILSNANTFYTGGQSSIGFALPEAAGALSYIQNRHGDPNQAWAFWVNAKTVDGYHWY